ncbi:sporulation protein YlmC with PRC-barrel domain [Haloactinopolyspora alba]|uniref:Sporulation protein YlmC with PRC-barrel domain n=1 Tax=Haloactinopolyspora alba TaxID=648780 RepID=A0A2P8EB12_9ACTN|nr:PRC-barrel domain-containing protein [Haloactinopolyspora alba]PSL06645.1 sporulation protein YlmC with PRC-barrel domain [Haloactinopolyspora alba]
MTQERSTPLVRLADTHLTLASDLDDIRGRDVVDRNGDEVGEVEDLVIDPGERRVRMLEVGSGGFLGIGEKKQLIPVDAVTGVNDVVHIETAREHVASGPEYDPDIVQEPEYAASVYDHYGYPPFWSPGYIYPGFPFYGAGPR